MRIAVTGATGFLGRHFVAAALAAGHGVRALARRAGGLVAGVQPVHGDLDDAAALAELVKDADALVHLAAHGVQSRDREWGIMLRANVEAPVRLLEVAARAGVSQVVAAGTCLEYQGHGTLPDAPWPEGQDPWCDEARPTEPNDAYGATKAAGGLAMRARARDLGLPLVYLRLASLVGPGDDQAKLLPSAARAALARRPFDMTGGAQVREWLHVRDAAAALLAALALPPGRGGEAATVLNVGTGRGVSLRALVEHLFRAAGAPEDLVHAGARPYRTGDPHWLVMRVDRGRVALNLAEPLALEVGIRDLLTDPAATR